MPIKIIHPNHLEIVGLGRVLIASPHATSHDADLYTGQIVEEAALTSRSFAVIGKVNKDYLDLNTIQSAHSELRKGIQEFIAEDGVKFVLEIYGKREPGVDIDAISGQTCSDSTMELVRSRLAKDFSLTPKGEENRDGPGGSRGQAETADKLAVEALQIRFGPDERQFQREKVIRDISEIAGILNARLVS